jgi:hypothetical protein
MRFESRSTVRDSEPFPRIRMTGSVSLRWFLEGSIPSLGGEEAQAYTGDVRGPLTVTCTRDRVAGAALKGGASSLPQMNGQIPERCFLVQFTATRTAVVNSWAACIIPPFDLFKTERDGILRWLGAVA